MRLADAVLEFGFAKDHSPASRAWYRSRLTPFLAWLAEDQGTHDIEAITAPLVRRYVERLRTTPSARTSRLLDSHTVHGHYRAILAFLHWAAAEDLLDAAVPRRLKAPTKEHKVLPVLTEPQLARLFAACDRSETPEFTARNQAVLAVLLDTGLRANELCSLDLGDVHLTADDAYLFVRKGKGRRQREVPLGKKARALLARYLHRARPRVKGSGVQAVFLAKSGTALTPSGLDQLIARLMAAAGWEHFAGLRHRGAHLFRHTFAARFIEAGGDIYRLSRLLGHTQVTTTEGYLRSVSARQARQGSISPLDALGK